MRCFRCNEIIDINNDTCFKCGEPITDLQRINYLNSRLYLKKDKLKKIYSHIYFILFSIILLLVFIFTAFGNPIVDLFCIVVCVIFLVYRYNQKSRIMKEIRICQSDIDYIQKMNNFEVCENCGYYKYLNNQCNNCNYNKIDNKKGIDRYSVKELSRAKLLVNILIFIGVFVAFGIAGNWESEYFEANHDDTGGWVLIFEIIPMILLIAGILFAVSNSYFNKKIKSAEDKEKNRE